MNKKWQADIDISIEQVKSCLIAQFSHLLPLETIQFIDEGWDNRVFLVNQTIIFRFPRRKVSVELIEHENTVLPQLQCRFALKIPHPIYQGRPCFDYPYPFQGYYQLKGVTAERISQKEKNASLEQLALFLKQLHSIDEKQALFLGAKPQVFDKTEVDQAIQIFKERAQQLIDLSLYSIDTRQIKQELEVIREIKLPPLRCLVHGDLHFKHLLFDQGRLSGIIDWGDVGINHPVVDLSIIWGFYPKKHHIYFYDIYGPVESVTWCYARFLALYVAITFLLYGQDIGDTRLVNEAIKSVKRINPKLIGYCN